MKLRVVAAFVTLVLSAPLMADEVRLTFWHSMSGDKAKLVDEIVGMFNRKHKGNIRVDAQFIGSYIEGLNKLRTSLMAKRGPHVAQIFDIGTRVMVDSGAVIPLQDFVAQDDSFSLDELLEPIRRYYEIDGKLYSLPFATSNPIIYYNVDAFRKAGLKGTPATFAELRQYAAKLTDTKAGKTGITWPLHSWFFEQFLARQGAELVNNENGRKAPPTEALFAGSAGVRVVNFWHGLVKEGVFANVGRGWEPAEQNFLAGRSAMLITSTSDVFEVTRKASFPVATAPIPAAEAGQKGGTIIGGNSLWIFADKPKKEQQASYRFLKFMASPAVQEKWHKNTGYFPIRKDVIAKLEKEGFYKKHPGAKTAIDQLQASPDIRATQGALMGVFQETREEIESAIEEVLSGRATAEQALKGAKAKTDRALQRYNRARQRS